MLTNIFIPKIFGNIFLLLRSSWSDLVCVLEGKCLFFCPLSSLTNKMQNFEFSKFRIDKILKFILLFPVENIGKTRHIRIYLLK